MQFSLDGFTEREKQIAFTVLNALGKAPDREEFHAIQERIDDLNTKFRNRDISLEQFVPQMQEFNAPIGNLDLRTSQEIIEYLNVIEKMGFPIKNSEGFINAINDQILTLSGMERKGIKGMCRINFMRDETGADLVPSMIFEVSPEQTEYVQELLNDITSQEREGDNPFGKMA